MVTFPPALSMPAFTASATVEDDGGDGEDVEMTRMIRNDKRTFCDVTVHRVNNDGNFGSRHIGVGFGGYYWRGDCGSGFWDDESKSFAKLIRSIGPRDPIAYTYVPCAGITLNQNFKPP